MELICTENLRHINLIKAIPNFSANSVPHAECRIRSIRWTSERKQNLIAEWLSRSAIRLFPNRNYDLIAEHSLRGSRSNKSQVQTVRAWVRIQIRIEFVSCGFE